MAFYQIRDENRAKLKISYSCGHRVSKSARYDDTLNNSPSHGAYTCACTESSSVLFEYLKLLCRSHVSVKLCGILSNVHTICFHFFSQISIQSKVQSAFCSSTGHLE